MSLNNNKRIFYAVKAGGFAPDGSTTYTAVHGLQSIGINTTFNIEDTFEIGQIETYAQVEDTPDIEVTLEKVLDGNPLIYHLATPNATSATLVGRSAEKASFALSIFGDTQDSASGTPNSQVTCSGMFVGSMNYTLPSDGNFTESVTLVGNHKVWASGSFTFSGAIFDNEDSPPSGVQRRQHLVLGSGANVSLLPYGVGGIQGITEGGYNEEHSDGDRYNVHLENVTISTDLGREQIVELGRRNPYFRYATFPVAVNCEITTTTTDGDFIEATEEGNDGEGNNLTDQRIKFVLRDSTTFDLGAKNKLTSVTQGGGDTGGGNETVTYSYRNNNSLTITKNNDPAGL